MILVQVTGEYGHLLGFDEHDPDNPEKVMNHCWVPVPALYCNCGADLTQLNQEEYCVHSLVNYKRKTAAKHSAGRSPIKKFPFATMLPYTVQYVQFLSTKAKDCYLHKKSTQTSWSSTDSSIFKIKVQAVEKASQPICSILPDSISS